MDSPRQRTPHRDPAVAHQWWYPSHGGQLDAARRDLGAARPRQTGKASITHLAQKSAAVSATMRTAGLAVPAVLQLDDPVTGSGVGDQIELVGLGDAVE